LATATQDGSIRRLMLYGGDGASRTPSGFLLRSVSGAVPTVRLVSVNATPYGSRAVAWSCPCPLPCLGRTGTLTQSHVERSPLPERHGLHPTYLRLPTARWRREADSNRWPLGHPDFQDRLPTLGGTLLRKTSHGPNDMVGDCAGGPTLRLPHSLETLADYQTN